MPADKEAVQQRTLWIGDVEPWMDESYIMGIFQGLAAVKHVKLIRDKAKNTPVGYGFVEFEDFRTAKEVLQELNGKRIPNQTDKFFKLNWASHGGGAARTVASGPTQNSQQEGFQVYVGELAP
jgi:RNA recognition motif-containing protein